MSLFYVTLLLAAFMVCGWIFFHAYHNKRMEKQLQKKFDTFQENILRSDMQEFYREMENYAILLEKRVIEYSNLTVRLEKALQKGRLQEKSFWPPTTDKKIADEDNTGNGIAKDRQTTRSQDDAHIDIKTQQSPSNSQKETNEKETAAEKIVDSKIQKTKIQEEASSSAQDDAIGQRSVSRTRKRSTKKSVSKNQKVDSEANNKNNAAKEVTSKADKTAEQTTPKKINRKKNASSSTQESKSSSATQTKSAKKTNSAAQKQKPKNNESLADTKNNKTINENSAKSASKKIVNKKNEPEPKTKAKIIKKAAVKRTAAKTRKEQTKQTDVKNSKEENTFSQNLQTGNTEPKATSATQKLKASSKENMATKTAAKTVASSNATSKKNTIVISEEKNKTTVAQKKETSEAATKQEMLSQTSASQNIDTANIADAKIQTTTTRKKIEILHVGEDPTKKPVFETNADNNDKDNSTNTASLQPKQTQNSQVKELVQEEQVKNEDHNQDPLQLADVIDEYQQIKEILWQDNTLEDSDFSETDNKNSGIDWSRDWREENGQDFFMPNKTAREKVLTDVWQENVPSKSKTSDLPTNTTNASKQKTETLQVDTQNFSSNNNVVMNKNTASNSSKEEKKSSFLNLVRGVGKALRPLFSDNNSESASVSENKQAQENINVLEAQLSGKTSAWDRQGFSGLLAKEMAAAHFADDSVFKDNAYRQEIDEQSLRADDNTNDLRQSDSLEPSFFKGSLQDSAQKPYRTFAEAAEGALVATSQNVPESKSPIETKEERDLREAKDSFLPRAQDSKELPPAQGDYRQTRTYQMLENMSLSSELREERESKEKTSRQWETSLPKANSAQQENKRDQNPEKKHQEKSLVSLGANSAAETNSQLLRATGGSLISKTVTPQEFSQLIANLQKGYERADSLQRLLNSGFNIKEIEDLSGVSYSELNLIRAIYNLQ